MSTAVMFVTLLSVRLARLYQSKYLIYNCILLRDNNVFTRVTTDNIILYYPLRGLHINSIISISAQKKRAVMDEIRPQNHHADLGSIQGSHRPIYFVKNKHRTRANGLTTICENE